MAAAATITSSTGQVTVDRSGQKLTASKGMELFVTDVVHTGKDGKVSMRFRDDTELDLHPDTHAKLEDFVFDPSGTPPPTFAVEVLQGLARTATGKVVEMNPEGFAINTPLGTAGIRGTTIWTQVSSSQVVFTVTEMGKGHVVLVSSPEGGTLLIKVPDSGVVITSKGEAKLDMKHLSPEALQKFIKEVVGQATDNETHISATSHGVFVIADAEFLASIGAINITDELGFVAGEDTGLMIDALNMLGFDLNEYFIADSYIPGSPYDPTPGPNPPPDDLPPYYYYGTSGPDLFSITDTTDYEDVVYGYTGNDTISTGKGNDTIYSGAGKDFITGGYGSSDSIYKQAELGGSMIAGDADMLDGATGDADYIEIGTSSTNSHVGKVYGDARMLYGNAMPGNDTIKVLGTLAKDGFIYGDADSIVSATVGTDAETGDLAHGRDVISVETLAGGVVCGDAHDLVGTVSGTVSGAFGDNITIGTMSGGYAYGDFTSIASGANASKLASGAFADTITVGSMSGGMLCGDASTVGGAGFVLGNDTIRVTGTMSGGNIFGDAFETIATNVTHGSDLVEIGGNMRGGTILGDTESVRASDAVFGSDTITVQGSMSGGGIYGDASTIESKGFVFGNDAIRVTGDMSGGTIIGDAKSVMASGTVFGRDTITVQGSMSGGDIYGDAEEISLAGLTFGNDSITIKGDFNNSSIFGDSSDVGYKTSFGSDTITISGTMSSNSGVFGDARILNGGATGSTLAGDSISVHDITGGAIVGDISILDSTVNNVTFGNDTLTVTGTLSGGMVIGDVSEMHSAATLGRDSITVENLSGGDVLGDAEYDYASSGTVFGNDTIKVTGLMSGGKLTGDINNLTGNAIMGNDAITVAAMTGGVVSGDIGKTYFGTSVTFGDDTIKLTGSMTGGVIYGDVETLGNNASGRDVIQLRAVESPDPENFSKIFGDAKTMQQASPISGKDGNDTISATSLFGVIYGDAETLEGTITLKHNVNAIGAFADNITVSGVVEDGAFMADGLSCSIYGDFYKVTSSAAINTGSYLSNKLFSDTITVGTLKGDLYGEGDELSIFWNGFGHDSITVTNLEGGNICGDFQYASTGSDNSIFGNDTITITKATGGSVDGDSGYSGTAANLVYGDDHIILQKTISNTYIYGDNSGTANGSRLGHDTIDASSATLTDVILCGDSRWGFGTVNLTTANKLGQDSISIGTLDGDSSRIVGDIYTLYDGFIGKTGTPLNNAFNDTISITTVMKNGMIFGDFNVLEGGNYPIAFTNFRGSEHFNDVITIKRLEGGSVFGDAKTISHDLIADANLNITNSFQDTITITTNMTGGDVYGDAETLTRTTNNGSYEFGGNTISVDGTMSGGNIYGSAETFTVWGDVPFVINTNAISIGTLNSGNIYSTYSYLNPIGFTTYNGCQGDHSVTIGTMNGGTVTMSDGADVLTISTSLNGGRIYCGEGNDTVSLGGLGDSGARIDFGEDGLSNMLSFSTGFEYTTGTAISLEGLVGAAMSVDLRQTTLMKNYATSNTLFLSESADPTTTVLTLNVTGTNADSISVMV